jgi:hypothetical protein
VIYKLQCPKCETAGEYLLGMHESDAVVPCDKCGAEVSRQAHRVWEASYQIQGDTVPRGCSYDYWDGNLGVRVKSKAHRADEMKRQGLRDYAPDPELKAARYEAEYIHTHAGPKDSGVKEAASGVVKAASQKKQAARIKEMIDKAPPFVLPD